MFVIRKNLSEFEGVSQSQRWNQDDEVFQTSYDNGETWVDTPASDPRNNPSLITPETSAQCDAAQGFSNFVRQFVDSTYEAFNVVGITSNAISIGTLWIPGFPLFWKVAQIVADGIIAIGAVTLAATFDEGVYDQIRDIAFCFIDSEGHFDQTAFDAIGEELQEEIGGSAFNITMALMYNLYGLVGFSNASIELAEGSDCGDAECGWCYNFDFVGGQEGWVISASGAGSYNSGGSNWHGTNLGGSTIAADIERNFTAAMITSVAINFSASDNGGERPTMWLYLGGVEQLRLDSDFPAHTVSDNVTQLYEFAATEADEIRVFMSTFDLGDTCSINQVVVTGIDENPFGSSNC